MIKEKIRFVKWLAFPLVCTWIVASSTLAIGADVVKASSDGRFVLLPSAANFGGGSRITRGVGKDLIEYLNRPESMATWDLEVLDSGPYRVELLYAMTKANQTRAEIKTSGGIVSWDPEANSSGWSDLQTGKAGVIFLKKGKDSLRIRPTQKKGWVNIGEIRLIPFTLLPVDVLKFVKAYHSQKDKIDQQTKADYMSIIRKRQKVFVQKEQFDEVGGLEKEIKRIEGMEVEELFGKGAVTGKCKLAGRWLWHGENGQKKLIQEISDDGRVTRPGSNAGWNRSVVRMASDGKSCEFVDVTVTPAYVYGKWEFLDKNNCSETWRGNTSYYERELDSKENSPTDDATVKLLSEYRGKWIFARQGLRDKYVMALKRSHLKYEKGGDLGISRRVKELIREPEVKPVDLEMEEMKESQAAIPPEEKTPSQKANDFDCERAILGKWVAEKEDTHITFFKSGNLSCPAIKEINMPRMIKYYWSYGITFRVRGRDRLDYAYVTLDTQNNTVNLLFKGKTISFKREEAAKSASKASSEN